MQKKYPGKGKPKKEFKNPSESTETRLNKYIANSGVCSRRDADKLIAAGDIKVNGSVVKELGFKVQPGDKVQYKGKVLKTEKLVYVLLNKPKGFITTTDDPRERRTVMELVKTACEERIYPVGRLDKDTTGLLLFTNDGELAVKLAHPSNNIKKIYRIELDQPITKAHFEELSEEIVLEDGPVKIDEAAILENMQTLGLEIHVGKNRIVRRIFEHFGYEVMKLDRVVYATLDKSNLQRGKWRYLNEREIMKLKGMGVNPHRKK